MQLSSQIARFGKKFWKQRYLMLLLCPAVLCLVVFKYIPIMGLQIAFKNYSFRSGIWGSPWAGLKQFDQMFHDITIVPAVINTLGISFLKLLLGFPIPIILALLLNEVKNLRFKKVVQTISYFPYFLAYSVVALMLSMLLAKTGMVNELLVALGILREPYLFLGEAKAFWGIAVVTDLWKGAGWSSIIYLAALTAISPSLYESATIDGAGRLQKMLYITLPGIKATIIILLIMNIGSIVHGANFDLSYLLGNSLNVSRSEILPTYILRTGIGYGRFSYATAVGLVESVVSLILVLGSNWFAKSFLGEGLF